jgi:hypothetical protein
MLPRRCSVFRVDLDVAKITLSRTVAVIVSKMMSSSFIQDMLAGSVELRLGQIAVNGIGAPAFLSSTRAAVLIG